MEADPNCVHWWLIQTERGATSPATCKRCGGTRRFPNGEPDLRFGTIGSKDTELRRAKEAAMEAEVYVPE